MDNRSVKEVLLEFSKNKVLSYINDLKSKLDSSNNEYIKKTYSFVTKNGIVPTVYENIPINDLEKIRKGISKEKYKFPFLYKVGEIYGLIDGYSDFFGKKQDIIKGPFYVPIAENGIGFLLNPKYQDKIRGYIESFGLDIISAVPKGLAKVTIIDKNGSGQNFPNLFRLHNKFTDGSILSNDTDIENGLEEIKHSMKTITQSITANGFASIEEYNTKTDEVPQRYNFIFIDSFPNGFNKKATENLISILEAGYKSGVYVFITVNYDPVFGLNQPINGVPLKSILKRVSLFSISNRSNELITNGILEDTIELVQTPLKNESEIRKLVNSTYKIKLRNKNKLEKEEYVQFLNNEIKDLSLRPIIKIEKVYPKQEDFWSKKSWLGVSIPFGKKGIENVYLNLGINEFGETESTHHAIIGGATGSGKTVLLHDLILLGSLYYSPRDLQFWLLDYKEGTEFAVYKDFPYVNILSMESEIEFGHEVLDKAIQLMSERGELFKKEGVGNLNAYNSKVPLDKRLPRIIIIIDEFQALLPKNPKIASKTNEKLDNILRLGRSFGINLLLSTQTLKGVDLDPAIMSNIPIRIALAMDEKDAAKLFAEDNTAPKYINTPGEGIYNKRFGLTKYNQPFQAFLALDDSVYKTMDLAKAHIRQNESEEFINKLMDSRFVYSGANAPIIDFKYLDTKDFKDNLFFIGEPSGLSKEDIFLTFDNDFGENLLMVGSDQEKASSIIRAINYQISKTNAKAYMFNFYKKLDKFFNIDNIELISNTDSEKFLLEIKKIYEYRQENEEARKNKIYVIFYYIESAKIFQGNSFTDKNIKFIRELIKNGPDLGIHTFLYASDYYTLSEIDFTKEISKFKKQIAFKGETNYKIFGSEASIEESKSEVVAVIKRGLLNEGLIKFKPYIFKKEI